MIIIVFCIPALFYNTAHHSVPQPLLGSDDDEPSSAGSGGGRSHLLQQQRRLAGQQEAQLERIGTSVGTLRNMSRQIGDEVEQQNV